MHYYERQHEKHMESVMCWWWATVFAVVGGAMIGVAWVICRYALPWVTGLWSAAVDALSF